jgi:DNA-binding transcriptional regulator LsrR (DeoR family)
MAWDHIPDDVRRFIVTSIPSVPYLEAMLLLHGRPEHFWTQKEIARRLYMNERDVSQLLADLVTADIVITKEESETLYRYSPHDERLRLVIDQLAETYSRHLIDVTNLIHSKINKMAQQFMDAFKWRKD